MSPVHTAGKTKIGALLLLGLAVGYALALLTFRQDTRLDLASGKVQTVAFLFPFSIRTEHNDRAFEVLFPGPANSSSEWMLVDRRRFLSLMDRDLITEGYQVLRAENRLVQVLTVTNLTLAERRDYATAFMDRLQKAGPAGVSSYATSIWEEHMLRASSSGKQ